MLRTPEAPPKRPRFSRFDRVLIAAFVALLLGAAVTASVDSAERERQQEARERAQAERTQAVEAQDLDGDGTPDEEDGAPLDASATESPERADLPEPNCAKRGITRKRGREGACIDEDLVPVEVVNRQSTLELREMRVRIRGVDVRRVLGSGDERTRSRGRFIVFRLSVTNRLDEPAAFYEKQFGLLLGRAFFRQSVAAGALVDGAFASSLRPIKPGATRTGTVVFDVPRRRARMLQRNGNLLIGQFTDTGDFAAPYKRVGIIRTYR